ncbi:MAG: hypothetical protein KKI02_06455 [Planctomycetes bacterium]|nr:hypothetical protein [Planctomycetota bacterium]
MKIRITKAARARHAWFVCLLFLSVAVALVPKAVLAQDMAPVGPGQNQVELPRFLVYIIPGKPELSTLYFDGSQIEVQTEER